ncbi:ABC transporter substrate-binding protein [Pseudomonas sp. LRF_L74]|uniref:ABC transporter substrate-binding protein n=1 Tax=Pseudomonas sp. LRF_L74 TaxID=3369422 RepID=UPI003F604901
MSNATALLKKLTFAVTCGLAASTAAMADEPIRIGALATLSGAMTLPESSAAARAVFDRVNAQGGIQGRKIEYMVQDDKGEAGATAQAGRELVDSNNVVAFAGSASLQDCVVNANLYKQRGVLSIPGVAGEFSCYKQKPFAPVSVGPARGTVATLFFASEVLKKEKVCTFLLGIPAHAAGNQWAIKQYQGLIGKQVALLDTSVLPNDDMTPHVLRAKSAGCDAIIFSGAEQMDLAWLKAMEMQGMTDTTVVFMTPAYTSGFARAAAGFKGEVYANSEYEPFLGDSHVLDDWRTLMTEAKVAHSSFAQGGYLSATLMVEALKRVEGPITRESLTETLRAATGNNAMANPMMGQPLDFGLDADHVKSSATKFVKLENGSWTTVTPDFVRIAAN